MNTEYKTNRHSCYSLKYHLVVVTKYRHKCINKEVMNRLIEISNNIFDKWGCSILEINGEADHLHILFEAPPQVQLSKLINNFKTVSSRLIRKDFAEYLSKFYWKPYFWSESYLILSTGGATINIIEQYIQNQATPQE
ncbi:IS200/IS605 family transposase [Clostridium sp.]|jgi:putative transposase|uniref:IS200/IS605 family transposase n=1 Tax=Clostridium sp. TaxID=1506 RepID=UPI000E87BCB6|nr:IS200/IS605 family transposase [Clostridiaceae bacterium]